MEVIKDEVKKFSWRVFFIQVCLIIALAPVALVAIAVILRVYWELVLTVWKLGDTFLWL